MIDNAFVFDGVFHLADYSDEALGGALEPEMIKATATLTNRLMGGVNRIDLMNYEMENGTWELPPEFKGNVEAVHDFAFNSPVDMAMIGNSPVIPHGRLHKNRERYYKFVQGLTKTYPDRFVFGGGVDPSMSLGGQPTKATLQEALDQIEHQIVDLGAKSIKFYPIGWRCDDESYAYPLYEKARSLGVSVVQFHKNIPTLLENVETQGPHDLQQAARDFPDVTFLLQHAMPLYFEETVNVVLRFPNIGLVCTPLIHYSLYRPRRAQEMFGRLLQEVPVEKLYWGSEGLLGGNPTGFIRAFWELEIPEDLQVGFGYPAFKREYKEKILGLNYAKLYGIDIEVQMRKLAADVPAAPAGV